jgi:hypothetical protein
MLAHQFILVLVSAFKRFESVLLTAPERVRQMVSGEAGDAELQEPETEQAA